MRYTQKAISSSIRSGGSGTTLDVAKDTGRKARGFDLAPFRADIEPADARKLPLPSGRRPSSSWIHPMAITSLLR